MTLDQLRAFLAVAEFRHFGRAASRLNITQPAMTKRVAKLEDSLGGSLFERLPGDLRLTRLAETMLEGAVRVIAETAALEHRARDVAAGDFGRLDIGFGLSTIDLAPLIIARYRARYPRIAVSLNDYSSAEQVDRLLTRRLDVGFVRLPVDSALAGKPLLRERLVLATTVQSDFGGVGLEAFNEDGFVMLTRSRGPGLADQIERWSRTNRFEPRVVQTADDIQTVLALVAAGIGHALLPSRSGRLASPSVHLAPLKGKGSHWQVGVVWRRHDHHPALERFIDVVGEVQAA